MNRLLVVLLIVLAGLSISTPATAMPPRQESCKTLPETGFSVCDNDRARFLSAFNHWGLQRIGYPISNLYTRDGFVTQAFQKAIMQWRPESKSVVLVNIFDDLHTMGFDQQLLTTRQVPNQLPPGWDGDLPFDQVVKKRQALLDVRPALRQAYFAAGDPLTFFGLPTSEVTDMGNHYAVRLQRAVLQEWKETVPWAKAGQVTIANGGDIAKELGALPEESLTPDRATGSTPQPSATKAAVLQPEGGLIGYLKQFAPIANQVWSMFPGDSDVMSPEQYQLAVRALYDQLNAMPVPDEASRMHTSFKLITLDIALFHANRASAMLWPNEFGYYMAEADVYGEQALDLYFNEYLWSRDALLKKAGVTAQEVGFAK